jgi:hypothetical protein
MREPGWINSFPRGIQAGYVVFTEELKLFHYYSMRGYGWMYQLQEGSRLYWSYLFSEGFRMDLSYLGRYHEWIILFQKGSRVD